MDHLPLDVRLAFRRLTCSPGFTVVAIVTLALAIGANTITFSALNGFLLRPLPVKRPGELVSLNRGRGVTFSYPAYLDLRDRNRTLAGLIGYRVAPVGMNLGGKTAHVWGYEATGNYFDVLGVHALLGRTIMPEDDQRSSPRPVIVLSYDSGQRRFGGDPAIVGRVVKVNGLDYTVIGVTARGFYGTELLYASEFWVPLAMEPQIEPGNPWLDRRFTMNLWVQGRLKSGVTRLQAEADLGAIAAQLGREHREDEGMRINLSPPGLAGNVLRGPVAGFASVLMAVAGLVLLIACANLANLLLARASTRRKEISVCLAIGAGKWQLIRQLLTESAILCAAGAGAGLGLAAWLLKLMASWRPPIDIPVNTNLTIDYRVLLFTLAASVATTLLFGLAPAFSAARTDILSALKSQLPFERARWWNTRDVLVAAQVALSVILLAGTVLVVRSLQQALTIHLGFNPEHAVAVSFDLGLHGYDENRGREFQRRVLERVSALPGIESAAIANSIPLSLDQSTTSTYAEGKPVPRPQYMIQPFYYQVTPGYFRTMQTRLLAGRDFTSADRRGGKSVAIINRALAERLFPNENALGRRMWGGRAGWTEVVGIVENGKYQSLSDDSTTAAVFWPLQQQYNSTMMIVARSPLPPVEVTPMIERTAQALDPELAFYQAGSLEDHLRLPLLPARIAAIMLGAFGLLAMVLAATGVYGVMAYAVSRRTREIGIRIAIGATARNVLAIVLRRTTVILSGATLAGLVVALAAARYFSPILYGVSPRDPFSYVATVLLVCAVALTACLIPARRAIAVEPSAALREE